MTQGTKVLQAAAIIAIASGIAAPAFSSTLQGRSEIVAKILAEQASQAVAVGTINFESADNVFNGAEAEASDQDQLYAGTDGERLRPKLGYSRHYSRDYDRDNYSKVYKQYDQTIDGKLAPGLDDLSEEERAVLDKYLTE